MILFYSKLCVIRSVVYGKKLPKICFENYDKDRCCVNLIVMT